MTETRAKHVEFGVIEADGFAPIKTANLFGYGLGIALAIAVTIVVIKWLFFGFV